MSIQTIHARAIITENNGKFDLKAVDENIDAQIEADIRKNNMPLSPVKKSPCQSPSNNSQAQSSSQRLDLRSLSLKQNFSEKFKETQAYPNRANIPSKMSNFMPITNVAQRLSSKRFLNRCESASFTVAGPDSPSKIQRRGTQFTTIKILEASPRKKPAPSGMRNSIDVTNSLKPILGKFGNY